MGAQKARRDSLRISAESKIVTGNRRGSLFSSNNSSTSTMAGRRSSLIQSLTGKKVDGTDVNEKIASRIDIQFVNGISNDEYEFELKEGFKAVGISIIKKGRLSNTVLGTLELPSICFEPDEKLHEEWFPLKETTETFGKGHSFREFSLTTPRPCYCCSIIMFQDKNNTDVQCFQCSKCGLVCHETCNSQINSTCHKIGSVRIRYLYIREPILVKLFNTALIFDRTPQSTNSCLTCLKQPISAFSKLLHARWRIKKMPPFTSLVFVKH